MDGERKRRWWKRAALGLGIAMMLLCPLTAWAGTSKCDATIGDRCVNAGRIYYTCCLWSITGGPQRVENCVVDIYRDTANYLYVKLYAVGTWTNQGCDPDSEGTCC